MHIRSYLAIVLTLCLIYVLFTYNYIFFIFLNYSYFIYISEKINLKYKSKYSILLFQFLASLVNLEHRNSEVLTLPNLRSVLSVADGKLSSWNDLNRYALKPARAEINQLSRFKVEVKLIKDGRHVDAVRLVWQHLL